MGSHISWLAVKGKAPTLIRWELRLLETAGRQDVPEAGILGLELPSKWYLVFFNDPCAPEVGSASLSRLSRGCEVVSCIVEEGSMVSMASGHEDGRQAWSVLHVSSNGLTDIQATGELPKGYHAIRDALLDKQATATRRVDYVFDLPIQLGEQIVGYRHDGCPGGGELPPYVVLQRA